MFLYLVLVGVLVVDLVWLGGLCLVSCACMLLGFCFGLLLGFGFVVCGMFGFCLWAVNYGMYGFCIYGIDCGIRWLAVGWVLRVGCCGFRRGVCNNLLVCVLYFIIVGYVSVCELFGLFACLRCLPVGVVTLWWFWWDCWCAGELFRFVRWVLVAVSFAGCCLLR